MTCWQGRSKLFDGLKPNIKLRPFFIIIIIFFFLTIEY